MTTAFEAIETSDWKKLRLIIDEGGFNLSQLNDEGMNPFHTACSKANTPVDIIAKIIQINNGALSSLSRSRSLPIHYACETGSVTTVKLLLECTQRNVRFYTRNLDINERTCLDRCWLKYLFSPCKSTKLSFKDQIYLKLNEMNEITSFKDLRQDLLDMWKKTRLVLFAASKNSTDFEKMRGWNILPAIARCGNYDTCWCPSLVMWFALRVNGNQIKWRDIEGNTILHIAASSATHKRLYVPSLITKSINFDINLSVLEMLAKTYPEAVNMRNKKKQLPLHLAIGSGKRLKDGISALTKINPDIVNATDGKSGLMPFMLAATNLELECSHYEMMMKEESLDLTYFLLQKNPLNASVEPIIQSRRKRTMRPCVCKEQRKRWKRHKSRKCVQVSK